VFTGIVEELGEVLAVDQQGDSSRLTVRGSRVVSDAAHGDSIAVNGVCLTVVTHDAESFTVDVMAESLRRSSLGTARPGSRVNLERAVRVSDRLGGHVVQGHVDGTGEVLAVTPQEHWTVVRVALPAELDRYVVEKGSITVDGVSLTVSAVRPGEFEVSLIPTTLSATTLGARRAGDVVNLEVDVMAKHIEKLLLARGTS
jgi:riboflavin synthase